MNFAERILAACQAHPWRLALSVPRRPGVGSGEERVDYGGLAAQVAGWQAALTAAGFRTGDRVVVLLAPSVTLYALFTALLALGLVPVLIERGMSRARIAQSLRASGARAVIGERALLRHWWLFPALWPLRRYAPDGSAFGVRHLQPALTREPPRCVERAADDHGIITFTSGSTGAPKGADRTHGSLVAQHFAIREHWPDAADDIDCTCFPVLVLHNLCCGIATVLPDADLAAPGSADPARIAAQLRREHVTRLSAAPAFLARLAGHCLAQGITLPQVRSVIVGGATLPPRLAAQLLAVFPRAQGRVVYGSTEAEPIADVDLQELIAQGGDEPGHLVGRPAHAATVAIVQLDAVLACDEDVARATLPDGAVGEILVAGDHVLRGYLDNPQATRESKVPRAGGTVWHRTGDTGLRDTQGRLWLVGRIKDAVTVNGVRRDVLPLEKAVDALPGVIRSALVQPRDGEAVLFCSGSVEITRVADTLAAHGYTGVRVQRIAGIPVDGRHNSKIDRPALRTLLSRGLPA